MKNWLVRKKGHYKHIYIYRGSHVTLPNLIALLFVTIQKNVSRESYCTCISEGKLDCKSECHFKVIVMSFKRYCLFFCLPLNTMSHTISLEIIRANNSASNSLKYKFKEGELLKQNERNFRHFNVMGHCCVRFALIFVMVNEKNWSFHLKKKNITTSKISEHTTFR